MTENQDLKLVVSISGNDSNFSTPDCKNINNGRLIAICGDQKLLLRDFDKGV